MSLESAVATLAVNNKNLNPQITISALYKHWISEDDLRRCKPCKDYTGKIYFLDETPQPKPPLHQYCRCEIVPMKAIKAGTATIKGVNGADFLLKTTGVLPDYYVTMEYAKKQGWKAGKWPSNFIPNKVITNGIYKNGNGHLPQAPGRVWYEADINYTTGRRDTQRIVWSNDGLIFVTYDHYLTFYEIN